MAIFTQFGTGTIDEVLHQLTKSRGGKRQHALFGQVRFDLISYFEGLDLKFGADYAEHARIGGKSMLQKVGDKLDEYTLTIVFHRGFCDPEAELTKLRALIAASDAKALVFANGDYKGHFVATDCEITYKALHQDGTSSWLEGKLTLKEYVEPVILTETTPKKDGQATEKQGKKGSKKPARTVKRQAKPRNKSQSVCRR